MIITDKPEQSAASPPTRIIDTVLQYRIAKVLLVAVSYDIFTHIDRGIQTVEGLCRKLHTNFHATDVILKALVALGYLKRNQDTYLNTSLSDPYLVEGRPGYLGHNIKFQENIWDAWSDLKNVVKIGRPEKKLDGWLESDEFVQNYIEGMADIATRPAEEISAILGSEPIHAILDVGAGPGEYARAILKKHPEAQATLLDLPQTLRWVKKRMRFFPEVDQISFREGNYHSADFGREIYDLVIMSHITHDEGIEENRKLIQKAYRALKSGGHILIHDFVKANDRTPSVFSALFSIHMLVYTEKGDIYSTPQYTEWCREAGFKNIVDYDIAKGLPNQSKILIGTRISH